MPQRSPIIFWLLVAATIAVNAVGIAWAYAITLRRSEEFYFGLWCGQMSVVAIWASFARVHRYWRWVAPFLFVVAAVALASWLYGLDGPPDRFDMGMAYLGLWTAQVAILQLGLWSVSQTSFNRRWQRNELTPRWQFSMKHLLIVMTVLAIFLVIARQASIIQDIWIPLVLWIVNNAILAIAAVIIQSMRWHGLLRLAATMAVAGILGFVLARIPNRTPETIAINLIQAVVLYLWLAFGGIVPVVPADAELPQPGSTPTSPTAE